MEVIGQFNVPASLPPLYSRMDGPQSRSGRGGEERNSQPLLGLEPPIIQPVAQRYTTELSRLLISITKRNLYVSHFTNIDSNLLNMRWAGNVARMGEMRNAYNFWSQNLKGIDHSED
jgi:hypothetical protein